MIYLILLISSLFLSDREVKKKQDENCRYMTYLGYKKKQRFYLKAGCPSALRLGMYLNECQITKDSIFFEGVTNYSGNFPQYEPNVYVFYGVKVKNKDYIRIQDTLGISDEKGVLKGRLKKTAGIYLVSYKAGYSSTTALSFVENP